LVLLSLANQSEPLPVQISEGEKLVELNTLQKHIRTLVTLEETNSPVISCYLTLSEEPRSWRAALDQRLYLLRRSLRGDARWDFEEALSQIEDFLYAELRWDTKGVAIFARGGDKPFFLPLEFQVPLPNWVVVNSTPNIYHLVELKDTYHRFVLMISTAESVRILEVNLGAVTDELWRERPALRKRIGREWTKEHYQSHQREQSDKFLKEKISVLDGLMRAGGYTYLMLTGNPWETARLRQALPKRLATKLIDTLPTAGNEHISDVVAATLARFIEAEEQESRAIAAILIQEILSDGLAVAGTTATLDVLHSQQVDVLVITKLYTPPPGWRCTNCAKLTDGQEAPKICLECNAATFRQVDLREEMVRLAEQQGASVEIVQRSDQLLQLGGVGALLRYRAAQTVESEPTPVLA
jgi:hypothetical protein